MFELCKELSCSKQKPGRVWRRQWCEERNIHVLVTELDQNKHAQMEPRQHNIYWNRFNLCNIHNAAKHTHTHTHTHTHYGFRTARSYVTNSLSYSRVIDITQERDEWADCIYLHLKKPFDKIPHRRLLWKLEHIGGLKGLDRSLLERKGNENSSEG